MDTVTVIFKALEMLPRFLPTPKPPKIDYSELRSAFPKISMGAMPEMRATELTVQTPVAIQPVTVTPVRKEVATSCMACFPAGSLVTLDTGVSPIEEVSEGDTVLDGHGYYSKVKSVLKRHYNGKLLLLHLRYHNIPIEATPEHPFFVIHARSCRKQANAPLCLQERQIQGVSLAN